MFVSIHLFSIIAICAQVTEHPLESKITVLSKGTSNGLIGTMPVGGHTLPSSTLGLKEEWKKAQKNAKKNATSEEINSIIPSRIPFSTFLVCFPWNVASRETSRHHCTIVRTIITNPKYIMVSSYLFIHAAIPLVKNILPRAPVKGQGLISTI